MSALLSDQIDRLTHRTRSIKATATQTAHSDANSSVSRPFTHAALYAEIGQLIRDVDATELGLFTLVRSLCDDDTRKVQIKRAKFVGATPLKRRAARREEKIPDISPEAYAEAALRCLQRYHTTRPMPRARKQLEDIIIQLNEKRFRVAALETALKDQGRDHRQNEPPVMERSSVKLEEETIEQLHTRLEELNERKRQMQRKVSNPKPTVAEVTKPAPPSSPPEDKFWGTPSEASRTLRFSTDLLLDEEADFRDLNDASFSILSPSRPEASGIATSLHFVESEPPPGETMPKAQEFTITTETPPNFLPKSPIEETHIRSTPKAARSDSVRINAEVGRITSKVAAVYGDLLALASGGFGKPYPPKDVIACLQNISAQTPTLESPSQSSVSNANSQTPSAQDILTAYLLTQLLSAPDHTVPLSKLKDSLVAKSKSGGMTVGTLGQNPTRILYGCVGKRLVKIDRSGGEQLVKFDC